YRRVTHHERAARAARRRRSPQKQQKVFRPSAGALTVGLPTSCAPEPRLTIAKKCCFLLSSVPARAGDFGSGYHSLGAVWTSRPSPISSWRLATISSVPVRSRRTSRVPRPSLTLAIRLTLASVP